MWPTFGLILALLFLFGIVFNWITHFAERKGWIEGYTALFVVIGVSVTVGGMGFLIGWKNVMYVYAGFVASGTPMIVGSIARYMLARERAQRCLTNHDPGQT